MEEKLNNLHVDFRQRIKYISEIELISEDLVNLFKKDLESIKTNANGAAGALKQVDTVSVKYNDRMQLLKIPTFRPKLNFLTNQTIVLMVGAFEVIIGDILRTIANEDPEIITWPDKNKKINIEPADFTSRLTLGDIFVNHLKIQGKSFHDLKSIHSIFSDYFKIDLSNSIPREIVDDIILMISYRHIIVHNNGIIDKRFLSHIHNISRVKHYEEDEELSISSEEMKNLENSLLEYISLLIDEIQKI